MKQDLTGRRFGKLTVISRNPQLEDRYYTWNCQCDCGGKIVVNTKRLTRGTITNCGCDSKMNHKHGSIPADLTGEVFGNLTVLEHAENKGQRTAWLCRCDGYPVQIMRNRIANNIIIIQEGSWALSTERRNAKKQLEIERDCMESKKRRPILWGVLCFFIRKR